MVKMTKYKSKTKIINYLMRIMINKILSKMLKTIYSIKQIQSKLKKKIKIKNNNKKLRIIS